MILREHFLLLSHGSLADTADLSGSSGFTDEQPIANLLDQQLSLPAVTSGLTAEIVVDLGRPRAVSYVGLLDHSGSITMNWHVQGSNDPDFATPLVEVHGRARPRSIAFGSRPWGDWPWEGRELTADGADAHALFEAVYARYWRVVVDDGARTDGIGWLSIGRLIVDAPWRPNRNISLGWDIQAKDAGTTERSRGGTLWSESAASWKDVRFELNGMDRDEAIGVAFALDRKVGTGRNVLVIVDPADLRNRHALTIYGPLAETTAVTNTAQGLYSKRFTITGDV